MRRERMLSVSALLAITCLVAGSAAIAAGNPNGVSTPRRMQGTWSSMIEIPPNDILGNPITIFMPELDTFTSGGAAITSSAGTVMLLDVDGGPYLAAVEIGQGNWRFKGGVFAMTQWRFITDANTGDPLGYLKIIAEWSLMDRNQAAGEYLVEMLELDMTTPYEKDGLPVMVEGPFVMFRLPVESLP